jgi:hypothetical protein
LVTASASEVCAKCLGAKWVCEKHPELPWPHERCDGAGQPCPTCNAEPWPEKPPNWEELLK